MPQLATLCDPSAQEIVTMSLLPGRPWHGSHDEDDDHFGRNRRRVCIQQPVTGLKRPIKIIEISKHSTVMYGLKASMPLSQNPTQGERVKY